MQKNQTFKSCLCSTTDSTLSHHFKIYLFKFYPSLKATSLPYFQMDNTKKYLKGNFIQNFCSTSKHSNCVIFNESIQR